MHPVRAFRLVASGVILVLAALAALQGNWPTVTAGLGSSAVAALMAVGVHGRTRAEAEAARAAGWRRLPPWGWPGIDLLIVLMLVFTAWPVALLGADA